MKTVEMMLEKVVEYGFEALFITVDAPELGIRERDMRLKVHQSAAVQGDAKKETAGVARAISSFISHSLCWENLSRITAIVKDKADARGRRMDVFLKGIHSRKWLKYRAYWNACGLAVDAVRAYGERNQLGIRGIVVSNHGARQVDTVKSGVQMLFECTRALEKVRGVLTGVVDPWEK